MNHNSEDKIMYKNVHYDAKSNKIHLWWTCNGENVYNKYEYSHDYFQLARQGQKTTVKDMFGRHMVAKNVPRKRDIPKIIPWHELAESDLKEEGKFLDKFFKGVDLKPNIDNIQIMYYDIEVAIGHSTMNPHYKIRTRIKESGKELEMTIKQFELVHPDDKEKLEVYDDKKNQWMNYYNTYYSSKPIFPTVKDAKYPVNAIAQYFTKEQKLYVWADKDFKYKKPDGTNGTMDELKKRLLTETTVKIKEIEFRIIPDEKTMLEAFIKTMHKHKTDVISGWNINIFDNPYVSMRLEKLGSNKSFSPIKKQYKREHSKTGAVTYTYHGISSLDYIEVYRDKFTFDNKGYYSLDNIARIELNKHKLEYDMTMFEFYTRHWDDFMLYNMIDTMLVPGIDDKKGFMNLALISAHNARITLEGVMGTLQGMDGLTLKYLHNKNMVLNDRDPHSTKQKFPGGYSWCEPGLYKYCISFDIQSLYPTILSQHNIGLETSEQFEDHQLKDVVRINDKANKKSYFFWPTDEVSVGRTIEGEMTVVKIQAQNILSTDKVVLYPNGENYQGQPSWSYDMGHSFRSKYIDKV